MTRAPRLLGMALLVASLIAFDYLLFDLGRYGTCASGGPYVSARECAPGTELKILGMLGAIVAGLVGAGLARSVRVALAAWGMLFCGLAITFLMIAFGPAAGDNGFGVVAVIVGVLFLAMGAPALLAAARPTGRSAPR